MVLLTLILPMQSAVITTAAAWSPRAPPCPSAMFLRTRAVHLCDKEPYSLQEDLKRAASSQLGQSLDEAMPEADRQWYRAGASAMQDALREAREQLEARKAEVGEEAALAELDASIRAKDDTTDVYIQDSRREADEAPGAE